MKIKTVFILLIILCACNTNIMENPPVFPPVDIKTIADLSPWHEKHKNIILWKDEQKGIYQIRVASQKQKECSLHQTRNLLFFMSMLKGDDKNFLDEYNRMMDEKLLDEMASKSYCTIMDGFRKFPDIKRYLEENADFSRYLPSKSKEYLEDIIELNFVNPAITNIQNKLNSTPNIEGHKLSEEDLFSAAALNISNNKKLYEMIKNDSFLIPIALDLNSLDETQHSAALLIHKTNKKLEFIFLDPLNWEVNTEKNYQKVIDHIYRITKDINYFEQSFIRLLYTKLFYSSNISFRLQREESNIPYKNIVKNDLFKVYKQSFCRLITPIDNEEIKKYRDIFACDK